VPPTTVSPSKLAYLRHLNCRALGSNRDHSKQAVCITVRARCKEELVVRTVVREGIMAKLQCPNIVHLRQNPKPLICPSSMGLIELRDARSKPSSAGRHPDQEDWISARIRRRRRKRVVNAKIATHVKRDACRI
jgi:hypothetical protein